MATTFPFFLGCGRSGTTLLRAFFDGHSQMAVPGESHFIVPMARGRGRYERPDGFATEQFLDDLLEHPRLARWALPEDVVRAALEMSAPSSLPDALRAVFDAYARRQGKHRYGDKTPNYVLHLPLLSELFPEARFVHLIRDGRDVALSYRDLDWGPKDLRSAALHWRECIQAGRAAGRRLGAGRYREVRYEALVENPARIVAELCSFLDLTYEPEMLRSDARADKVTASVMSRQSHQRLFLPPIRGLRDWRRQMSPADVCSFHDVAGDVLADLGYETTGPPPGYHG